MKMIKELNEDIKKVPKRVYDELENSFQLLFKFRYPKLFILLILIFLSYSIFNNPVIAGVVKNLDSLSYLGIFVAGMLFAFGFSAPFAVGFLLASNPSNLFLAAFIGGIGAAISDFLIFRYIKVSFSDEFKKLKDEKPIKFIKNLIHKSLGLKIGNYILYVLVGLALASPLPDELGVIMLAGLTNIKERILIILGLTLNTIGIYIILSL